MVRVYVELSRFAATATRAQLKDMVHALEDAGAAGVSFSDHIFVTENDRPRSESVAYSCEPLTSMAAVVGMSSRLAVQTTVVNTAWIHPALLLRQFAQLAVLAGGQQVTAGLGAGWSVEEFDALGIHMPSFRQRMDRFEEVVAFAHSLFSERLASITGVHVTARQVPLSPPCVTTPDLMIGGGSDRILDLAGRYADVLELHGDPRHGKVVGATMEQAKLGDIRRRALTTVTDLATRMQLVRAAESRAGRPPGSVAVANTIWYAAYGDRSAVAEAERQLCRDWAHIPDQRLSASPYLLLGEPGQIADTLIERHEAYGLGRISLTENAGVPAAPHDPIRFCQEVVPRLP
jgi:alkanesulfonate monooxygenase SsuD/methylene tetrahydromethanopterin reductase-like flavin-dependent oxidoreductase (luciferase family)